MSRYSIVFDLDDTLYLERDYVLSGFRAVGRWLEAERNLGNFANCAWDLFASGTRDVTFQHALTSLGCSPEPSLLSEMVNVYRSHVPEIRLPSDSIRCLAVLTGTYKMGLITDGRPIAQYAKCEQLGLTNVLSSIICTGVWGSGFYKPHPRAFEFMEHELGSPTDKFVYVADNPSKDFTAPLARGWKTVRIRRSGGLHAHLECAPACRPHLELENLGQFPQAIATF